MNKMRTQFQVLRVSAPAILRSQTPYRTGNLRNSILTNEYIGKGFYISIGREQAPYVVYVNEPWISPRWRGRENPREGFIHRAAALMASHIETNMNVKRVE